MEYVLDDRRRAGNIVVIFPLRSFLVIFPIVLWGQAGGQARQKVRMTQPTTVLVFLCIERNRSLDFVFPCSF